jgi:hypothetical protein
MAEAERKNYKLHLTSTATNLQIETWRTNHELI